MQHIHILAGPCVGECAERLSRGLMPYAIIFVLVTLIIVTVTLYVLVKYFKRIKHRNPNGFIAKKSGKVLLILLTTGIVIFATANAYRLIDRKFTEKRREAYQNCFDNSSYLKDSSLRNTDEYQTELSECNSLLIKHWGF